MKRMYVGGEWVEAIAGTTRAILSPHDNSVVDTVAEGGRADAEQAIAAARRAFDETAWPTRPVAERAAMVAELAGAVRRHAAELARLETLDTGKALAESEWDLSDVADVFEYYAGLADRLSDEPLPAPNPDATSCAARVPVGVCGQISPWNYPLLQASWKLAPALLAGNTVVIKPSELTPLTTHRLVELAEAVGFDPGVVNLVLGPGPTVGAPLAESHDVDLISFTGGVATGQTIMRAAAGNLKRIALELGGKNPHLVFADADLDVALDYALNAVFFHAGQICSAGSRLLLQASIADDFEAALATKMADIRLGSGLDPRTTMGPLISTVHRDGVARNVDSAMAEEATLRVGGRIPDDPALAGGNYYEPTLLTGCHAGMTAVREEIFGPVITVERFETEAEALRLANDTPYGLSAGFWTRDPGRIERLKRALRFGTVWANDYNVYFPAAPWGGLKRSGIGRELGHAGLDEYTELQHRYENTRPTRQNYF